MPNDYTESEIRDIIFSTPINMPDQRVTFGEFIQSLANIGVWTVAGVATGGAGATGAAARALAGTGAKWGLIGSTVGEATTIWNFFGNRVGTQNELPLATHPNLFLPLLNDASSLIGTIERLGEPKLAEKYLELLTNIAEGIM